MKIIIDYNKLNKRGNLTYKDFFDIFSNLMQPTCNLNYDAYNLSEYLWQNRFIQFDFCFANFDLKKILSSHYRDENEWKNILFAINSFVLASPTISLEFENCLGELVTEIKIDKKNYQSYGAYSYKGFYEDIFARLDGKNIDDFTCLNNCNYNADILNEFLWYNRCMNIKFVFSNFDLEQIKAKKTYDNYEWGLIIDAVSRFVNDYPNNYLKFAE